MKPHLPSFDDFEGEDEHSRSRKLQTQSLLARAQGGDAGAYEKLWGHVERRLEVYVRCRLGSLRHKLDPQDVVQELYLEAHGAFERFRSQSAAAFGAWLYRIADGVLSRLRDSHGAQKRGGKARHVDDPSAMGGLADDDQGPPTRIARREEHERLVSALEGLEEQARELVILRFFHELTLAETGTRLGISTSSVARQQDKALAELKRKLGFDFRERF